jgi:hypothetical protein
MMQFFSSLSIKVQFEEIFCVGPFSSMANRLVILLERYQAASSSTSLVIYFSIMVCHEKKKNPDHTRPKTSDKKFEK